MKSKTLKLAALLFAVVLLFGSLPVAAKSDRTIKEVQAEIDEKKQYISDLADKIERNKDNREAAEAALKEYEGQYNELVALIDEQEALIDSTGERLDAKAEELSQTIVDIQDSKDMYTRRLQAIYDMNASGAMMATLLAVDSFADAVAVGDALQRISQKDVDMLESLADQKQAYEEQKVELENTIETLTEEMATLQENRDWCTGKMQEMQGVIANANYQIQVSEQETEQTEEEVEKLLAELAAIFASLQSKGSQAGDESVRYEGPLLWPAPGCGRVTSYFGDPRSNTGYHYGIDIPGPVGSSIVAAASGRVITATWHYSYGYYIVLDHGQGLRTLYAHCSELWVGEGATVAVGDPIAGMGNTGDSYGSHLHFEVHEHGTRQNPLASGYLQY